MIQLEHLNLVVTNIEEMIEFYQTAFPHWQVRSEGTGKWYGKDRRWLHFGDQYQYLTFNDDGEGKNRDHQGHQVGVSHFAFVVSNINAITKRLTDAGYQIYAQGAENPHRKNVYFLDPQGFEVEFVQYLSDVPSERNNNGI